MTCTYFAVLNEIFVATCYIDLSISLACVMPVNVEFIRPLVNLGICMLVHHSLKLWKTLCHIEVNNMYI